MLARIEYALRETWASFRRNLTLTMAAVLTSAIALLLVGATFLIQRAFENLLLQWRGDVAMIVFVRSDASPEQIALIDGTLRAAPSVVDVEKLRYLDKPESYAEAQRIFAGDPVTLSLLTPETIPTQFKVVPLTEDTNLVRSLAEQYRTLPGVEAVALAEDEFEVISTLSGFVRTVTLIMSLVLLAVAVGLIWNTIRTAMFARRREIEVMKLVGATNWFIRVPFMLEGLVQGLIGAFLAIGALAAFKPFFQKWLPSADDIPLVGGFQVGGGEMTVIFVLLGIVGIAIGAIGAGIAVSRFLDV